MNVLKEFKNAGMISKKLMERVVTSNDQTPAPVNPAMAQNDANISGHSTADKPIADQDPAAATPEAAPQKDQKQYLMQALKSSIQTAEACMESICEGRCFEAMTMDPASATELQDMYSKLKEWKQKLESWTADHQAVAGGAPGAPAGAPQGQTGPVAGQQQQSTNVQAPPSPITGAV